MGDARGRAFFFASMRFRERRRQYSGVSCHIKSAPVDGDSIMWAVLPKSEPLPADLTTDLDSESLHSLAITAARPYHPLLRRFVDFAEPAYTAAVKLSGATKPAAWHSSRATLVGDAVRVMPPRGGHGGNTALRDSTCLAQALRKVDGGDEPWISPSMRIKPAVDYSFREVTNSVAMLNHVNLTNAAARFINVTHDSLAAFARTDAAGCVKEEESNRTGVPRSR